MCSDLCVGSNLFRLSSDQVSDLGDEGECASKQLHSLLQIVSLPLGETIELGTCQLKDKLEVGIAEMPLQIAPVCVVGKSVVARHQQVDRVDLWCLAHAGGHVRQGAVHVSGDRPTTWFRG